MELWRDVIGYEGYYQVSDDGRVRSMVRLTPTATAAGVRTPWRVLRYGRNNQGRLQVTLSREGATRRFQVHRLVLEAFAGPCPEGLEGLHNDGNHLDCRIGNLHWGTHTENMRNKTRRGTRHVGKLTVSLL